MKFWYKTAIIISLVLFLQVIGPFLKEGLFLGHDSQLHTIYLRTFDQAFRDGQFPVRWIDWFHPGFNQPLFNFYQPGFYYLYLLPRIFDVPYLPALNLLTVSLWLTSALLMFLFVRRHFGNLSGILGAYFYMLAPYHIVDVFVRSALPEFTALSFVPGIFWGFKAFFDTNRSFYLGFASIFIALVTISHPPTIIMFSPIIFFYFLYLLWLKKSVRFLLSILGCGILGFGLISFFMIPAFFEQQYIQTIYLHSGYYDFHHHFVCLEQLIKPYWGYGTSEVGCSDRMPFQLGLVHWLVILVLSYLLVAKFVFKKALSKSIRSLLQLEKFPSKDLFLLTMFLGLFFVNIYIMFPIAQPIWETLPYIPYIQYAWRFLIVVTFLSSFIAAGLLMFFKKDAHKLIVFAILIALSTFAYSGYLHPASYGMDNELVFGDKILHPSENLKNFTPEPGYMPKWTDVLPPEENRPASEAKLTSGANIDKYKLKATVKQYLVTASDSATMRFYTHYYPGWQLFIDRQPAKVSFDNIYGYMDTNITAGNHEVTLIFRDTPLRNVSNSLSLSFLIILIILLSASSISTLKSSVKE